MSVLLLSSNQDDKEFFEAAAKAAELPLKQVASPDLWATEVSSSPNSISVIDVSSEGLYKNFENCVGAKFGLFSEAANPNRLFFVASGELQTMDYIIRSDIFGHFIQRTYNDENQIQIARLLKASLADRAFGLESFMGPGTKSQKIPLTQSQQKLPIVDSLKAYLLKVGFKSRAASMVCTAVDEVLMNAIYDAPVDETGKQIYGQTPRTTPLDLSGKNAVEINIAFDGKNLGVGVVDLHGSINKKTLMEHIGLSYENSEYKVKITKAGAGLGLSHVYRNCGGLVFSYEIGTRTEVFLFFKKTDSVKDFKDQFRFLSTFTYLS